MLGKAVSKASKPWSFKYPNHYLQAVKTLIKGKPGQDGTLKSREKELPEDRKSSHVCTLAQALYWYKTRCRQVRR